MRRAGSYVCGVDRPQAAEDVVQLSGAALQVTEISCPSYSQLLLTVQLSGKTQHMWNYVLICIHL